MVLQELKDTAVVIEVLEDKLKYLNALFNRACSTIQRKRLENQ